MSSNNDNINITLNIHHHDDGNAVLIDANQPVSSSVYTPPKAVPKKKRWLIVLAVIVLIFWAFVTLGAFSYYGEAALSTRDRQPLAYRAADDMNFYTYKNFISDETGWLDYKITASSGLEDFYEKTGIIPFIYIADNINGSASPTRAQLNAFADKLYSELFTDEAHLLFVYVYMPGSYMDCYVCGTQAAGVFDEEAGIILQDYIYMYQADNSLSNSQFIEKVFTKTAGRIMTKTESPWIAVIIFALLAVVFAVFITRQQRKYKTVLDELKTEELLQIPLEKFGDPEMEELMKKYDDKE